MDPERQPLLSTRCRRIRPLTYEEVMQAQQELVWRRTRFFLIFMFWALMAMFLSIITCIVIEAQTCNGTISFTDAPTVPPVHMSFAPLISRLSREQVYAF